MLHMLVKVYGSVHLYLIKRNNFLRHILYISFSRDTYVFTNGNLSHLTLIIIVTLIDNLSVVRFSMHNLGPFSHLLSHALLL